MIFSLLIFKNKLCDISTQPELFNVIICYIQNLYTELIDIKRFNDHVITNIKVNDQNIC